MGQKCGVVVACYSELSHIGTWALFLWRHDGSSTFPSFARYIYSMRSLITSCLSTVTKEDIQSHFSKDGTGNITEVKLMNGFGFIEYDDPLDARDMVPGKSGTEIKSFKQLLTMSRSYA